MSLIALFDETALSGSALEFPTTETDYLSMTNAEWEDFDRSKFAISAWVESASAPTSGQAFHVLSKQSDTEDCFRLSLEPAASRYVQFAVPGSGGQVSATTWASSYLHIYALFDLAALTASERIRIWLNGTENGTGLVSKGIPTQAANLNSSGVQMGRYGSTGFTDVVRIYQCAFFSGTLPAIGDVYSSVSPNARDVSGLPGLWSLINDPASSITADFIRSAAWTENGTVATSTDIPT